MKKNILGQQYQDGDTIIKQGDVGNCLYVIQEGKVGVFHQTGDNEIKVTELGKTDFFGEMGLFEKDVRSCTVRSIGESKVLTIDKKNFYKTIQQDPSLAYRLLEKMSKRLRDTNKMLGSPAMDDSHNQASGS
jgi:CRP/FNR family transcriptional regulator/CRP/FNR family cyclic AMP-dependent transcriptional regulator